MGFGGLVVCVGVYLWYRKICVGVEKEVCGGFHEATELPGWAQDRS